MLPVFLLQSKFSALQRETKPPQPLPVGSRLVIICNHPKDGQLGDLLYKMVIRSTSNPYGGHSYVSDDPSDFHPISRPRTACPTFSTTLKTSLLSPGLLLHSTLLPSLALNSSLASISYTVARLTNRLEAKDLIWPLGPLLNAWWSAVFRHQFAHHPVSLFSAYKALARPEKLVLTGVTLWGGRLFYRVLSRMLKREKGRDKPAYESLKRQHGFSWNKIWWKKFVPEIGWLTLISLPVVTPFRLGYYSGAVIQQSLTSITQKGWAQALSVGLFTMGLTMEVLADWQLDRFKMGKGIGIGPGTRSRAGSLEKENGNGVKFTQPGWTVETGVNGRNVSISRERENREEKICKEGVWGIVRHPNYLGDALVHLSFPLMLYASDLLTPIAMLGPLANYLYLRCVGGDKTDEYTRTRRYSSEDVSKKIEFDRYRRERNSFWPDKGQIHNKWTWIVVGCGVAGALIERLIMGVV
ncbi:Putative protein of unknown function [Podospora comata]|uniref:Steroid 5-alpha reductase C-terminal domain-containing protein n=1 Tax=Podospora comata TaxID=48703 RepID=A0ABY6S5N6_PODCO|nr:Putative protein of unknown function [Podospora comata]